MTPEIELKGGYTTTDPRLDRLPEFDERSRRYASRELIPADKPLRSRGWLCRAWLDQGSEGACVGFAWTHELAAVPVPVESVDNEFARGVYRAAQGIDQWPGEDYEGTSVLAGAKIVAARGYMNEYRWAFDIDDVLRAVSYLGPVVIGIDWYQSMFRPRPSGLLEVSPGGGGGHAILLRGVSLRATLAGEPGPMAVVRLHNSWGRDWGLDGECFLRVDDLEQLLADDGDCCVPVRRIEDPVHEEDDGFLSETGEG